MQSNILHGRYCVSLLFAVVCLNLSLAHSASSQAVAPAAVAPAAVAPAAVAPAAVAPAAVAPAAVAPDPVLKADIQTASAALQFTLDKVEVAKKLATALQNDAPASSSLSLDAQVQVLNSVTHDVTSADTLMSDPGWKTAKDADTALTTAIAANPNAPQLANAQGVKQKLDDAQSLAQSLVFGTGDGSLTQAAIAIANYVSRLATQLDTQLGQNLLIRQDLPNVLAAADDKPSPQPDVIRRALVGGMAPLITTVGSIHNFEAVWATLNPALKAAKANLATPNPVDAVDKLIKGDNMQIGDMVGKLPGWFGHMIGPDDAGNLDKTIAAVTKALKDNNRISEDLLNAPIKQTTARTEANQLTAIAETWPKLVALLEPEYPTQIGSATGQFLTQSAAIAGYNDLAAALDELLTGDLSKFVGDQVRLFYFTDVPRLMHVLNPTTHRYPDDGSDPQATANTARQNLIQAGTAVAASLTAVNEAKTNLRSVQEEIRLVDARAADAAKQAATAHVLLQRIKKQQTDLAYKVAHPDPAATPDALQALKDQQTVLDARVVSATTATGNADTAATAAKNAQAQFATDSAALPQKLLDAQNAASSARADLDKQRVIAANLAQVESDAFANSRDNAPYLEATPRVTSNDPGQRVILFAYPDSKTLYIRGLPLDVEKVKEIVAVFDRPVPQARITLWTLQFNGSFSKDLNKAVQQVDHRLLLTRTNIGLVQDVLRDSISYVVNKAADSSLITDGEDSNGRLRRYKFYQPEVLERLGYDLHDGVFSLPIVPAVPALPDPDALYAADFASDDAFMTRFTLPDPIDATTLGEMMFVLSLARQQYREAVLLRFLIELGSDIPTQLPGLKSNDPQLKNLPAFQASLGLHLQRLTGLQYTPSEKLGSDAQDKEKARLRNLLVGYFFLTGPEAETIIHAYQTPQAQTDGRSFLPANGQLSSTARKLLDFFGDIRYGRNRISNNSLPKANNSFFPRFPSAILGSLEQVKEIEENGDVTTEKYATMTPNQNEILLAIQAQARDNIASEIRQTIQNIGDLPVEQKLNTRVAHQMRMQYLPLVGFLYMKFNKPDAAATTHAMTWLQRGMIATGLLAKPYTTQAISLNDCEDVLKSLENLSNMSAVRAESDAKADVVRGNTPSLAPSPGAPAPAVSSDSAHATSHATFKIPLVDLGQDPLAQSQSLSTSAYQIFRNIRNANEDNTLASALGADRQAWIIAKITGQHNSLSRATPRVAAADDMIKRLVITAEDDLDYFFVQPALEGIRDDASSKGMEFASLQRESILVSNRLVARVDPRANADLELQGAVNFLDEASQLASIADRFKQEQVADKVTSSGPAALAGTLSLLGDHAGSALGIGAAASLLGDLLAQPTPPGEIYSINSGSLFQVTPIFDPSGQALRFKFDYAGTTDVREPDKTTNPSIPRVERHTVNTEVQLTNLELREVSRFEANSALGVPQVRTGGLPLIKHVPILRDIPILGYFTETGGQKAVRQQSMIFAQTSIYPTVSDIVNLLVDIPPVSGLNTESPPYLQLDNDEAPAVSASLPTVPSPVGTPAADKGQSVPSGARQRDKAKDPASISDFILPPGMQH